MRCVIFYVEVVDMNFRSEIILSNIKFYLYSGMWKRKRWKRLIFLWKRKRKHFDERGWKRKANSKAKVLKKEPEAEAVFSRFRILNLATTVGVKSYNNNNNTESSTRGMVWNGKMEWNGNGKFRYGIWKLPEMKWNGRFQE